MRRGLVGAAVAAAFALAPPAALACPFCSIGARDTWTFILLVVGSFIAGAAMVLAWTLRTGQWSDPEGTSRRVLELDRATGVRI